MVETIDSEILFDLKYGIKKPTLNYKVGYYNFGLSSINYSLITIFSIASPCLMASITSRPSTTLPKQV